MPEPLPPMHRNTAISRLRALGVSGQGAEQLLAGMPLSDPRDRGVVSGLLLRMLAAEPGMRVAEIYDYPGSYAQTSEAVEPGSGKVSSRMIAENY
jgi:hypothetical protein